MGSISVIEACTFAGLVGGLLVIQGLVAVYAMKRLRENVYLDILDFILQRRFKDVDVLEQKKPSLRVINGGD